MRRNTRVETSCTRQQTDKPRAADAEAAATTAADADRPARGIRSRQRRSRAADRTTWIRRSDWLVFALPVLIALLSAALLFWPRGGLTYAVITVDGQTVKTICLDTAADQTLDLKLPCGNVVAVKDGKIGVVSAACPDQTCVRTGFASRAGRVIVCIPSRLIIRLTGGDGHYDILVGEVLPYGS